MGEDAMKTAINDALEKMREAAEAVDNLGNSTDIVELFEANDMEVSEIRTPIEDAATELEEIRDSLEG